MGGPARAKRGGGMGVYRETKTRGRKEVLFYEKTGKEGRVRCRVCPQLCSIDPGATGVCGVRTNVDGVLYATNYGACASMALDPTEKKPLYHFYPGSTLFSVGSNGCNLSCGFCQNWELSQGKVETQYLEPGDLVARAREVAESEPSCIGLAYTYSEPFMWYEYVLEAARLARKKGLLNVLVTNGYINPEPLDQLLPYVDAVNIDVKAFTGSFYQEICGGRLRPVLKTVEKAYRNGCHVEVTNLVIPGLNDSKEEISRLVEWLASLGPQIPLHFSRYFPSYRFNLPPTPLETLYEAREIALRRLRYVYLGNVRAEGTGDTTCPKCNRVVISRNGYGVEAQGLAEGKCTMCGTEIDLVGRPMTR